LAPDEFHTPVLLQEAVDCLIFAGNGIFVDGTLGGGGHAEAILQKIPSQSSLICFDADADAIRHASQRLAQFGDRVTLLHTNFRTIKQVFGERKIEGIAGLLLDLGVSSYQLDEPSKGFSFQTNERLDMRMDRSDPLDAFAVVNGYGESELADVLWKYGEERESRRIVRAIVRRREQSPIATTGDFADVVRSVVGGKFQTKTLARVFQAVRIEVNRELENLQTVLEDGITLLRPGGRFVVISYHSLEDRIVKQTFRAASEERNDLPFPAVPMSPLPEPTVNLVMRRPVIASEEEIRRNPRARSAKMRAVEKR
jgi:16S rRNA (cytosine1402-N4)-methyltransferase